MSSCSDVALIGSGRVCGTSASSAPSVTNVDTPTDWANSSSSMVKDRQRVDGSMPCTRITSRSVPEEVASRIRVVGQLIRRRPSSETTRGRLTWKS